MPEVAKTHRRRQGRFRKRSSTRAIEILLDLLLKGQMVRVYRQLGQVLTKIPKDGMTVPRHVISC